MKERSYQNILFHFLLLQESGRLSNKELYGQLRFVSVLKQKVGQQRIR